MSYHAYKVLHLLGVVLLFMALGGLTVAAVRGPVEASVRRAALIAHGIALAVVLVAGFGLLARLGFMASMPTWAWLKIGIWLLLGLAVVGLKRVPATAKAAWIVLPLLGTAAAWLAVTKPTF